MPLGHAPAKVLDDISLTAEQAASMRIVPTWPADFAAYVTRCRQVCTTAICEPYARCAGDMHAGSPHVIVDQVSLAPLAPDGDKPWTSPTEEASVIHRPGTDKSTRASDRLAVGARVPSEVEFGDANAERPDGPDPDGMGVEGVGRGCNLTVR